MATLNTVILIGNLTRDPETRVTPKGTAICQFGLAVSHKFKVDGESREETTFVDIEAWGKTAELVAKYTTKGKPVLVQGRLKLDQWEDKQTGQKRSKLKVVCENIQFLGSGKGAQEGAARDDPSGSKLSDEAQKPRTPAANAATETDDDIPF